MFKYVVLLALALVLSVSGALGLTESGTPATSFTPAAVPGANADPAQVVAALEEQVRRVPTDHRAWADLGFAYFEEAGVTFDQDLYAKADAAIARSLELKPNDNVTALANGAAISASHHDFVAALKQADAALAIAPYDPIALGIRVDALTQLGKFRQQMAAVRTADRRQPGVGTTSRYSYAVELRGDLDRARSLLMSATGTTNRADLAHLLSHAADLDRRQGRLNAAQAKLDRALQAVPGDTDSVAGLALLDTARGDLESAVTRWQQIVETTPLPEHYIELGETLDALGREEEAQQAYDDSVTAVRTLQDGGANIDLELACSWPTTAPPPKPYLSPRPSGPAAEASTPPTAWPGLSTPTAATAQRSTTLAWRLDSAPRSRLSGRTAASSNPPWAWMMRHAPTCRRPWPWIRASPPGSAPSPSRR